VYAKSVDKSTFYKNQHISFHIPSQLVSACRTLLKRREREGKLKKERTVVRSCKLILDIHESPNSPVGQFCFRQLAIT
jgi:hypothetical protein